MIVAHEEERNAIRFEAINLAFNWTNEEWAAQWLPWIRMTVAMLALDDRELTDMIRDETEMGVNAVEGWVRTEQHLEALIEGLEAACSRSFLVLERLGYTPDDPPPLQQVN